MNKLNELKSHLEEALRWAKLRNQKDTIKEIEKALFSMTRAESNLQ